MTTKAYLSLKGQAMKSINDLVKADDPAQSIGYETPQRGENTDDRLKRERVMDRLWLRLAEIYGSSLTSQYGDTIPESWELLLMEVTPEQIKDGLNALATRENTFPPNAAEFRQLCMPTTISPDGKNSAAYLSFDDPKHPNNSSQADRLPPPRSYVSKRKMTGKNALADMKGLFK
jgi:hypothetical protein